MDAKTASPHDARALTRRGFMAVAGGAALAVGATGLTAQASPYNERMADNPLAAMAPVCCDGCSDHCTAVAFATDEGIGRMVATGAHPLCEYGFSAARLAKADQRVLEPTQTTGGNPATRSWDDAITAVGSALAAADPDDIVAIVNADDPQAWYVKRLMAALGAGAVYEIDRAQSGARRSAVASVLGNGDLVANPRAAKLVIVVDASAGKTDAASRAADIAAARQQGAYVVLIDPVNPGSGLYDEWIAVNPGTEGALLDAVAKQVVEDGAYDHEFAATAIADFPAWAATLSYCTGDWAEKITGVAAARIEALAARVGAAGAATAIDVRGVGALGNGFASAPATVRSATALAAAIGALGDDGATGWCADIAWGEEGLPTVKAPARDTAYTLADSRGAAAEAAELIARGSASVLIVDDVDLDALTNLGGSAGKPAAFTVALATTESPTTALCDYVLPKAAFFEEDGLPVAVSAPVASVAAGSAAASPAGNARTVAAICADLAEACGCAEAFDFDPADAADAMVAAYGLTGAGLAAGGAAALPGAPSVYASASGLVELTNADCAAAGCPEACGWDETAAPAEVPEGAVWLMAGMACPAPDTMLFDEAAAAAETPVVVLNRALAEDLGVADGGLVALDGADDTVVAEAVLSDLVHPQAAYWPVVANGSYPTALWGAPEAGAGFGNLVWQTEPVAVEKAGA